MIQFRSLSLHINSHYTLHLETQQIFENENHDRKKDQQKDMWITYFIQNVIRNSQALAFFRRVLDLEISSKSHSNAEILTKFQ